MKKQQGSLTEPTMFLPVSLAKVRVGNRLGLKGILTKEGEMLLKDTFNQKYPEEDQSQWKLGAFKRSL